MARKTKSKTQLFVVKFIVISILVAAASFAVGSGTIYFFRHNDYFKIRSVTIDPSLSFINKHDLGNLIGKNIFDIDLLTVRHRLSYKYPEASDLKVVKHFPGQIAIVAKQRFPFAQIQVQDKMAILDDQGVVLSLQEKGDKELPHIIGAKLSDQKLTRGLPLAEADIRVALEIARDFKSVKSLSAYAIEKIDIENLSKILLTLSNGLDVMVDRGNIGQRMKVLGVVLSQDQLDLKQINYVDLRFKEPIIGKKK
jgi:cell division septal protein FtsQ